MTDVNILAVTGHRPKKLGVSDPYGEVTTMALYHTAVLMLNKLAPTWVWTGMALGWDMAVAQAAVDLRIPFYAAIPFLEQPNRWPRASRERYNTFLEKAAGIEVIGTQEQWREAMTARNEFMVTCADHVAALLRPGTKGGTADCVIYARSNGRPVTNVWNAFEDIHNRFVVHDEVTREG